MSQVSQHLSRGDLWQQNLMATVSGRRASDRGLQAQVSAGSGAGTQMLLRFVPKPVNLARHSKREARALCSEQAHLLTS